ncbi:MAG TPA: RAMP superfamily CRISPR-associated protein [Magnetospirillum sp.]|nr:RAMP superfamily CRISPR-associated protein [Magnetospirillum sp.]
MSECSPSDKPIRRLARVTVGFRTPFLVGGGRRDIRSQKGFVRDANGLPALPGSSIAGVLRHAFTQLRGQPAAERLFGAVLRDGVADDASRPASRLAVSWGAIHGADDQPVEGLHPDPASDPVLAAAQSGHLRNHVGIDHRGAAADRRKFDETVVGAGHRFSFELLLAGDDADADEWAALMGLLHWPGLRFGAGSRRGFGAFDVEVAEAAFDLADPAGYDAFCSLPRALGARQGLSPWTKAAIAPQPTSCIRLRGLRAEGPWLFGGGTGQGDEDMVAVAEPMVTWLNGRGSVSAEPVYYLPGSGIKGVLAHRVAWHFNRLTGIRADGLDDPAPHVGSANAAVRALFGEVGGEQGRGRRGILMFEDLFLPTAVAADGPTWHVSMDRFTGGARRGLLFSERPLAAGALPDYTITLVIPEGESLSGDVRAALDATLDDLRRGRLTFGSGGGRGNGTLRCDTVEWWEWDKGQTVPRGGDA